MDSPLPGMESVVATVSGYHGSDRFKLIKLISQTGASYVGAMSRSTTHLVCWKFEGKKYDLAKKFDATIIVNHGWVEECVKQGKRVPEYSYMLQCGQELGPVVLEVGVADKNGFLKKNRKALSDKSNICDDTGLGVWTDSLLLNENLFPEVGKSNGSKLKNKHVKRTSKQEHWSSNRYSFQECPLSGLVALEHADSGQEKRKISKHEESSACSSKCSAREKRKILDDIGSTLAEPSRTGRRLVKKNVSRDNLETVLLDSDQECYTNDSDQQCYTIGLHNTNSNTTAPSKHTDGERNVSIFDTGGTSDAPLNNYGGPTNEAFDDVEEMEAWNHLSASKDSNLCPEDALAAMEMPDTCSPVENLNGKLRDIDQHEPIARLAATMELSCVICLTEFSSTRGILPCGHRFCYSCIQNWADFMASKRKISTCPLCKASFVSITKVEGAATSDQKIYSQTIPCASSTTDIVILTDEERHRFGAEPSLVPVCNECRRREPEDLLISCHLCQIRCIHSYCLDPPVSPWTCIHCKDLQMLYHHSC